MHNTKTTLTALSMIIIIIITLEGSFGDLVIDSARQLPIPHPPTQTSQRHRPVDPEHRRSGKVPR